MAGTRRLLRFKVFTSHGFSVLRLIGIACSPVLLAHTRRTAALMGVMAVGLNALMDVMAVEINASPLRTPTVVSTVALPAMAPGAVMLGLITIAVSGIRT
jgi:hypothetical protein